MPFIGDDRNHIEFNRINPHKNIFFLNHGCHHILNMMGFFPEQLTE